MLAVALGLLLAGSSVGVHIEARGEVPLEEATRLAETLADAVEAKTKRRTVLDDPLWPECKAQDRCLDAVRARTKAEDLVMLRVYSGPTKLRLIAERLTLDGFRNARVEVNVPRDDAQWKGALADLTLQLFPEGPDAANGEKVIDVTGGVQPVGAMSVLPWVFVGTSVVAFGLAGGFALSSQSARDQLLDDPPDDATFPDTYQRMRTHSKVAQAMVFTGAASLALSGILFIFR